MSKETMEERFDKKFNSVDTFLVYKHLKEGDKAIYGANAVWGVKYFINSELQRERGEIVEMLDEVVDKHTTGVDDGTEARKVLKGCPDELRADIINSIKER